MLHVAFFAVKHTHLRLFLIVENTRSACRVNIDAERMQDPPLPLPVLGLLFESFMSRFVSRWFVDDEIEALLVSYRVFRVRMCRGG